MSPASALARPGDAVEQASGLLLGLFAGLAALHLVLALPAMGLRGTALSYRSYLLGWALVPAVALGVAAGAWRAAVERGPAWLAGLLGTQALVWGAAWSSRPVLQQPAYLWAAPAAAAAVAGWAWWRGFAPVRARGLQAWALPAAALALALGARHFDNGLQLPWPVVAILAAVGLGLARLARFELERGGLPAPRAWDAAFLIGMGLLILPAEFSRDAHHQGFILGPLNELLHGRTPLVDLACQYGVGLLYWMALPFAAGLFELSYHGAALLQAGLYIGLFAAAYLALRSMCRSQVVVWTATLCALLQMRFYVYRTWDNLVKPQGFPQRFGPALLLLLLAARRRATQGHRAPELLALGVAATWSFEAFAYAGAGYAAFLLMEAWSDRRAQGSALRAIARPAALAGASVALALLALTALTRWRGGAWPDWQLYTAFIRLYALDQLFALPVEPLGTWALVVGAQALGLVAAVHAVFRRGEGSPAPILAGALTVAGIVQFTYFLGRSHPAALVVGLLPVAMAGAYWTDRVLRSGLPGPARLGLAGLSLGIGAAFSAACLPRLAGEPSATLLRQVPLSVAQAAQGRWPEAWDRFWASYRDGRLDLPEAVEAARLARKHLGAQDRVLMLLSARAQTEAHLLAGKGSRWAIANPQQDALVEPYRGLSKRDPGLEDGELIIVGRYEETIDFIPPAAELQKALWRGLDARYAFELVEAGDHGVRVLRARRKGAGRT